MPLEDLDEVRYQCLHYAEDDRKNNGSVSLGSLELLEDPEARRLMNAVRSRSCCAIIDCVLEEKDFRENPEFGN